MTAYLNSFTGNTIASSNASLNQIIYTAAVPTVNLVWNLNGYDTSVSAGYYAATYLIVNGSAVTTPILLLPNAQQVSPGEEITIVNTGTNTLNIKPFGQPAATDIVALPMSQSVKLVLQNNTSAAGTWIPVQSSVSAGLASVAGLAGRGLTTRANDSGTLVFDSVWTRSEVPGGTVTLYPADAAKVLTFSTAADITLADADATGAVTPNGTYFFIKNISNARLNVTATVLDGDTNGFVYINPGAFGLFVYAGLGAWFSMAGIASVGSVNNTSANLGLNATVVDCASGPGAAGSIYTMTNQDFGSVIRYNNVQTNQEVVLPLRVAIYVVYNSANQAAQNINFTGGGTVPNPNSVTVTGSQFSVLATDGIGNVYPGISSLPGGQFVNANSGNATLPGIFFDNDSSSGFYNSGNAGTINTAIAGLEASTLVGDANSLTWTLGTVARIVNATINGNLNVTGTLNAQGGIDGGVI